MFEATTLVSMIDSLDYEMPDASNTMFYSRAEYGAWKKYHEKAREVQNYFNNQAKSIEHDARQKLWDRFNKIRDKGNDRFADEKKAFENATSAHRGFILSGAKFLHWSPVSDILFFFDPTSKEEILSSQRELNSLKAYLTKHKGEMSKAHKDECWECFREIQDSHNRFFDRQREAYESRKNEWRGKVEANINGNREKLSNAQQALDRAHDRRREAANKRDETTSDKWRNIFDGWIDEADSKIRSIEDSIERIKNWISEGEDQLR